MYDALTLPSYLVIWATTGRLERLVRRSLDDTSEFLNMSDGEVRALVKKIVGHNTRYVVCHTPYTIHFLSFSTHLTGNWKALSRTSKSERARTCPSRSSDAVCSMGVS